MLDRDKIEGYEIIAALFWRSLLTVIFTLTFLVAFAFLLLRPTWVLAVVNVLLGGTTFQMVRYYFPSGGPEKRK